MENIGGKIALFVVKTKILILLPFLLASCDPYKFNIEIDENGLNKTFNFECGKIDASGGIIADKAISIFLKTKLNYPIIINPSELKIKHKEVEVIYYTISLNGVRLKETASVSKDCEISISTNTRVQSGDTIKINVDNFILCKEQPLGLGDVSLVFVPRK